MKVLNILNSGDVVRFHAVPGVDKQKNSEHQWGVALIVATIKPDCSKELILAALTHDSAEIVTGDIPFTVKKARPDIKPLLKTMENSFERENGIEFTLSQEEESVLKIADTLEGMNYCLNQIEVGHIKAWESYGRWKEVYCSTFRHYNLEAEIIFNSILDREESIRGSK